MEKNVYLLFPFLVLTSAVGSCFGLVTPSPSTQLLSNLKAISTAIKRLPVNVKPVLYNLSIHPNLLTSKIVGNEIVSLKIQQSADTIVLNCKAITITSAKLTLLPSKESLQSTTLSCSAEELLSLKFSKMLPVGDATLALEFTSNIATDGRGCFQAPYSSNSAKDEKHYFATFFEPTLARSCFPCWDEPAFKAQFNVTLIVPNDEVALSNMPEESSTINGSLKTVTFKTTPVMSTYLLVFVVGVFESLESTTTSRKIPLRFFTVRGKKDQAKFALDITTKSVPFYESLFKVPYPLQKLDSIALPTIDTGGEEDFGFITYVEGISLIDSTSSEEHKSDIANEVCHEISHQWMGNLVTMEFWDQLWLKEGFADLLAYYCTNHIHPEYDVWKNSFADEHGNALYDDSQLNSQPLEPILNTVEDIINGNGMAYTKGSSVYRMIQAFVGDQIFWETISTIFTQHAYGVLTSQDLFTILEKNSSKAVIKTMSSWMKVNGYPLLMVESSTRTANNEITLTISQRRNLLDPAQRDNKTIWMVPLLFAKKTKPTEVFFTAVLDGKKNTVTIPDVTADEWLLLNPEMKGFYRVIYSAEALNNLNILSGLKEKSIPDLSRISIVDNLFWSVMSDYANSIQFLNLMKSMDEEDVLSIRDLMERFFQSLFNILAGTDLLPGLRSYGLQLMAPLKKKLGFLVPPKEDSSISELRSYVLYLLFLFEDQEFIQYAVKLFEDNVNHVDEIPITYRTIIYRVYLSMKGRKAYNDLLKIYKTRPTEWERNRLLLSFDSVTDKTLVPDILAFCISKEIIGDGTRYVLIGLGYNAIARDQTWEFIQKNYNRFREIYKTDDSFLTLLSNIIGNYTDEKKIEEISQFLNLKKLDFTNSAVATVAYPVIRMYSYLYRRDIDALTKYFKNK